MRTARSALACLLVLGLLSHARGQQPSEDPGPVAPPPTTSPAEAEASPPVGAETPADPAPSPQTDAATAEIAPPTDALTVAALTARIAAVEALEGLSDADRAAALEKLRAALDNVKRAEDFASRAADLRTSAKTAPDRIGQITAELAAPASEPTIDPSPDATLAQLEQELANATAARDLAVQRAAENQEEPKRRSARRAEIPDQLAAARERLSDVNQEIAELAPTENEASAVFDARRAANATSVLASRAEIDALDAELASFDARQKLLPLRTDLSGREVTRAEKIVVLWQGVVDARRKAEAERTAKEAKAQARNAALQHPVLQVYAQANQEYANRLPTLAEDIRSSVAATEQTRAELAELLDGFESLNRRLEVSGLSRATGLLLRREFEALPAAANLRRDLDALHRDLADTEYQLVDWAELRGEVSDTSRAVDRLMAEAHGEDSKTRASAQKDADQRPLLDEDRFAEAARELVQSRRELLNQLLSDANTYFVRLADQELVTRRLLQSARAYEFFIEERILWVRSIREDWRFNREGFRDSIAWLFDREAWTRGFSIVWRHVITHRTAAVLIALSAIAYFILLRLAGHRLRRLGQLVSSYKTDLFAYTVQAIVLTLVRASRLPVILGFLGWILVRPIDQASGETDLSVVDNLSVSLRMIALIIFPLEVLRAAVRPSGLAVHHLRWPKAAAAAVRRHSRVYVIGVLPVAVLARATTYAPTEPIQASLGRVLFTISLVATAFFLHALLRPGGPVLRTWLAENRGHWLHRTRRLWYAFIVASPFVFVIVTWLGYAYTAVQLSRLFILSLALFVGLVLAQGVMLRWLFFARRRVALEEARRRREAALAEAQVEAEAGGAAPAASESPPPADDDKLDLPAISAQTRSVFTTVIWLTAILGLFGIWRDVTPALRMLDRVQLLPRIQIVETLEVDSPQVLLGTGQARAPAPDQVEPAPPSESNEAPAPTVAKSPPGMPSLTPTPAKPDAGPSGAYSLTLSKLLAAIIWTIGAWVAFRNLPGLLDILLLQRLPLDAGSRYAISTVTRYLIAIIGAIAVFAAIGLTWGKLQWLAAALTFGLAFGLQEIVANFVSGLILLWERPFRVGDTVTAGTVSGTVTRIRMRGTTIQDWDRKELIIPNKTFITGEVINWSLTDPILRAVIPVGVAYGSDTKLVEKTLLKIAHANPNVLKDPEPSALFLGFGNDALQFELRVFVPSIDYNLSTKHAIHMEIDRLFNKLGISIAFPQLDLHLRTLGDLPDALANAGRGAAPTALA